MLDARAAPMLNETMSHQTTDVPRRALICDLAAHVAELRRAHPVRVAVDGVDAAGKTTLANELAAAIESLGRRVIRASVDGFHHPAAVRRKRGLLSPDGYFHDSFNYPALVDALLQPLCPGGTRLYRRAVFDFRSDQAVEMPAEKAEEDMLLMLDGVFLLRPELRDYFDFSIFVHADFDVTLKRAEARDLEQFGSVEEVRRRYLERYIPGQRLYLASVRPEAFASVVIDNSDLSSPVAQYRV